MTAARSPAAAGRPRRLADLALGARLTFAGGRDGWVRTMMTALGVGVGVAVLLLAISAPAALNRRSERIDARSPATTDHAVAGPHTLLFKSVQTTFRKQSVSGLVMQAEGAQAPVPPGLDRLPAPGEAVVSPALRRLLDSPDGALLAPRIPYRVVATIGDAGLSGPSDLYFYAGSNHLDASTAERAHGFGEQTWAPQTSPVLVLVLIVIAVVTLLPVVVFLAAAVRFGSDQRDRRLAALRLLGADRSMAARIAAGEASAAALLGLVIGAGLFLGGRRIAELFTIYDGSMFAADIRPDPLLAVLVVAAVLGLAVGVTLLSLRAVVIEPLGVFRRTGGGRGRLWWRLVPPAAGMALLYPLLGTVSSGGVRLDIWQPAAGIVALLIGVALVLPWLVEAVVGQLRGGSVAWQLAVRRLQLHAGSSGRVVNGIAVAVAGAIALQMLFAGVEPDFTSMPSGVSEHYQARVTVPDGAAQQVRDRLRAVPGVEDAAVQRTLSHLTVGDRQGPIADVLVADCRDLLRIAGVGACRDGAVYRTETSAPLPAGQNTLVLPDGRTWRMPAVAGTMRGLRLDYLEPGIGVIATTGAVPAGLLRDAWVAVQLRLDRGQPDALERVRNIAYDASPDGAGVDDLTVAQFNRQFVGVRRALLVGAVVTLLLIGLSLLVGVGEQLRERRRALAVLAAFGTRRGTLGWSVLWQTALPVVVGLALAVPAGLGLGELLLRMLVAGKGRFDPTVVAAMSGAAAGVILLVTVCSLPALWRLMRAEGLRME